MPTLEEVLADAQIADDLEINFGDKGKFKLGDLRAADKSRKAKAATDDATLRNKLAEVEAKKNELTALATEAAALVEKMKKEEPPAKKGAGEGEIDFDADPIYGPLMLKVLKPLLGRVDALDLGNKESALAKQFAGINQAVADIARIGLHDRYETRWNAIPAERRPKDKTWKDYVKIAAEKGILDEFKLPDPVEALNRELAPTEAAALTKQLEALKTENETLKRQAPRMPRPGAAGAPGTAGGKDDKHYDTAEALVDAAFADPLIQEITGRA